MIASPTLVVLVGPPASGKSTWAAENFSAQQIVCADTLRGVVGEHELDLDASDDAFEILDRIVAMRLGRQLTTVIDTTGLNADRRAQYLAAARLYGVQSTLVVLETSAAECKRRNRERSHPVPMRVIDSMARRLREDVASFADEGWDDIVRPEVSAGGQAAPTPSPKPAKTAPPTKFTFGLHISSFEWISDKAAAGAELAAVAQRAEAAGFESLWVMDHLIQIPQLGREWDQMFEPYTTLAYLASATERIRLGVLVSPVTTRHAGVLAKLIATLDVLSGGRAIAGVGAGSFAKEHELYGIPFGSAKERLDLLEETLRALPVILGSGAKPFSGDHINIERAVGYPRPIQDPVPIIVGGSGEQRTLKLAATLGSGCNIFGDLTAIERRVGLVGQYLDECDRSADDFAITHLGGALLASDRASLRTLIEAERPSNLGPDRFAKRANAGTIDEHVERYTEMAELGVNTAIVNVPRLDDTATFDAWTELISRFES